MQIAAIAVLATLAATPPTPTRWVEDHAGFVSPAAREALDARLEAYEHATGHQVVVWIGKTLDGASLADWAVRTFEAWKVGRKGFDDGIAMFLFGDDRTIDIEVGYGLEDKVPDAAASRIIRDVMAPRRSSAIRSSRSPRHAAAWGRSPCRPTSRSTRSSSSSISKRRISWAARYRGCSSSPRPIPT